MGQARRDALRGGFNRTIKLAFHGATVSSDAGLFPYRDLDEAAPLRVPAPAQAVREDFHAPALGQNSACRRCGQESVTGTWVSRRGGLHSRSKSSSVELDGGQLGNVGSYTEREE